MQIQALHTAHKLGWTPAYDWWADHQVEQTDGFAACARWMETAPVMPSTVLGLELLLQDRSLDLQMAADLILADVSATLHIMRLTGHGKHLDQSCSARMVHCLANLDTATWFATLAANSLPFGKTTPEIARLWKHCRCVAQYAKLIAESLGEVSPEEAYLAGLLHEVENMPSALGKRAITGTVEGPKLNQVLSPSLVAALQSAKQLGSGSIWRYVLASAHALANAATPSETSNNTSIL